MIRRLALSALFASALALLPGRASAQCVQGATGEAIRSCRLHVVTGPILAGSRVLGLAGAYQGIAEGLEGYAVNAAAPAVRVPWSWDWFDYDLDASFSIPTPLRRLDDLEFDGVKDGFDYSGFIFVTVGGNVQLGPWGFGVTSDLTRFDLTPDARVGEERWRGLLSRTKVLLARTFLDGDLVVGGGLRQVGFNVGGTTPAGESQTVVSAFGLAPEFGALLRPEGLWLRAGATFRMPVSTGKSSADDAARVDRWWIPMEVNLPWEIDLGIAMQGGARPLNLHWPDPHGEREKLRDDIDKARALRETQRRATLATTPSEQREKREKELMAAESSLRAEEDRELRDFGKRYGSEARERYQRLSREYLLFTLGMLIAGPTADGISLESFFTQTIRRAGAVTTYSPRAGVETELVPNLLRLRLGTYIEPSRFTLEPDWRQFRQHVTTGFDLHLFHWTVFGIYEDRTAWRLTSALDVTHNYWNYGVSVGIWR